MKASRQAGAPLHFAASPQALRRRARSRSTTTSGMITRKVAPPSLLTSAILPPWARTSSRAMARPRPVPPVRATRGKARKVRAFARPACRDRYRPRRYADRACAPRGDDDPPAPPPRSSAPARRCGRYCEHAEELFAVGIDLRARRAPERTNRCARAAAARACRRPRRPAGASAKRRALGRRSCAWPKSSVGRIADGAIDGGEQLRREALDARILDIGKRSEISCAEDSILRMSWLILDIARPRSARFFCCFRVFCKCSCIAARCWLASEIRRGPRRRQHPRRIGGICGKLPHARGHPPDRRDHHPVDRKENQRRGEKRDDERQEEALRA